MRGTTNAIKIGVDVQQESFVITHTTTQEFNFDSYADVLERVSASAEAGRLLKWGITRKYTSSGRTYNSQYHSDLVMAIPGIVAGYLKQSSPAWIIAKTTIEKNAQGRWEMSGTHPEGEYTFTFWYLPS